MARPTKNNPKGEQIKPSQTPEALHKLEEAFAIDCTVEEACYYADISPSTYYLWVKENPKLSERYTALRNRPVLLARQTVVKKIPETYTNAMDYLKRKRKLEFADAAQKIVGENGGPIELKITWQTPNKS